MQKLSPVHNVFADAWNDLTSWRMSLSTQQTGRDMAFLQCESADECVGSPYEKKPCHNPETKLKRIAHTFN